MHGNCDPVEPGALGALATSFSLLKGMIFKYRVDIFTGLRIGIE